MNSVSNVQFGSFPAICAAMGAAQAGRKMKEEDPGYRSLSHELYKALKKDWNDKNGKLHQVKKLFIQA